MNILGKLPKGVDASALKLAVAERCQVLKTAGYTASDASALNVILNAKPAGHIFFKWVESVTGIEVYHAEWRTGEAEEGPLTGSVSFGKEAKEEPKA